MGNCVIRTVGLPPCIANSEWSPLPGNGRKIKGWLSSYASFADPGRGSDAEQDRRRVRTYATDPPRDRCGYAAVRQRGSGVEMDAHARSLHRKPTTDRTGDTCAIRARCTSARKSDPAYSPRNALSMTAWDTDRSVFHEQFHFTSRILVCARRR